MTDAIEDLLAEAMRDQVRGLVPAPGLVARAARRRRRNTAARVTGAVVVAGAAAAVAVGLTIPSAGPATARPGTSTRLLAAMTTSAQRSYRLHLVNTAVQLGQRMTPASPRRDVVIWYADYTGTYDPATGQGSGTDILRTGSGTPYGRADGAMQVRLVSGDYYIRLGGSDQRWREGHGSIVQALMLNGGRAWAPTDGASADPSVLLDALRSMGRVTYTGKTGTGSQTLDTYRFSYHNSGDGSVAAHTLTGVITVHGQSNLIARIRMQTTVTPANTQLTDSAPLTFKTVMTFSDYGIRVTTQAPMHPAPLPRLVMTKVHG